LEPEGKRASRMGVAIERRQSVESAALRRPLYLLLLSAGIFLVLACLNVGTLSLAEGEGRQREMATRIALGGSRTQIARYLLLESAVIATAGTVAGVILAGASRRSLLALSPIPLPPAVDRGIDLSMLPFVVGILMVVLFLCGSVPAWTAWRRAARTGIPGGSRGVTASGGVLRHLLVAGQFALATIVLVTAALLTRSLFAEMNTPAGFATENRIAIQIRRVPGTGGAGGALIRERLSQIPGVSSVALTRRLPLRDPVLGWQVVPAGAGAPKTVVVSIEPVSDEYFATMGIPIVAGRAIEAQDARGSAPVVVISRSLAGRLWPGQDPIGRKVTDVFAQYTVVGVAADVRDESLDRAPEGILYPAVAQTILPGDDAFVLHFAGSVDDVMKAARATMHELAPGAAIRAVLDFNQIVADVLAADRYRATLSLLFALLATFLAAIGLSALVLRDVASRMKEFAIRFSLGASRSAVVQLPLRTAAHGVLLGALLGAAGSIAVGRFLASYLFGVESGDPVALAITVPVLSGVVLATLLIALRRTPERDLIAQLND
jgi:putative ABC transport system permease protein